MRTTVSRVLAFTALLGASTLAPARAQDTVVTPNSANPAVNDTPAFGTLVAGGQATNQFVQFGLILSDRGAAGPSRPTGIFNDPPRAFAGVNASNVVDLVSPVDGRFVVPNTLTLGLTNLVEVLAGNAAVGTLTLRVFDSSGVELSSATNPGSGASVFSVNTGSFNIASFRVEGTDSFGVQEIRFNTPTAGVSAAAPEPGSLALLAGSLLPLAGVVVRRRKA